MNKKDKVITEIFEICRKKGNYEFHNDLVKFTIIKINLWAYTFNKIFKF